MMNTEQIEAQRVLFEAHVRADNAGEGQEYIDLILWRNELGAYNTVRIAEGFACWLASATASEGRIAELEAEVDKLRAQAAIEDAGYWHDGSPPNPYDKEWFIAWTTYGERVVLKALDKEFHSYDFTTADKTYIKRESIKRWMQFPDSEYWKFGAALAGSATQSAAVCNDPLSQDIEADATAFEAILPGKPARKESAAYPWGWCYTSEQTQNNFRAFCNGRKDAMEADTLKNADFGPLYSTRLNAKRYEFLRAQHESDKANAFCVFKDDAAAESLDAIGSMPGELDQTIDAAIAAIESKGGA